MQTTLALLACGVLLSGCTGMNDTQQRALTGTAGGAAAGAIWGRSAGMPASARLPAQVLGLPAV